MRSLILIYLLYGFFKAAKPARATTLKLTPKVAVEWNLATWSAKTRCVVPFDKNSAPKSSTPTPLSPPQRAPIQRLPRFAKKPTLQVQTKTRAFNTGCGQRPVVSEPSGTDDNCNDASQGLTSEVFTAWVNCMMGPGCPKSSDNRYAECQRYVVPSSITDAP